MKLFHKHETRVEQIERENAEISAMYAKAMREREMQYADMERASRSRSGDRWNASTVAGVTSTRNIW